MSIRKFPRVTSLSDECFEGTGKTILISSVQMLEVVLNGTVTGVPPACEDGDKRPKTEDG
jgi:hypothetical protein